MTPENIAGFKIPEAQLRDLLEALDAMRAEADVIALPTLVANKAA